MLQRFLGTFVRWAMSSSGKPNIVFVLGAPGSGKGTQCGKIAKEFNFVHLSAGDLLREERAKEGSKYGELIEEAIKNGKIVPVEITCSLIEAAMERSESNKFLIDGFPRNQNNLDGWNKQMAPHVNLLFVLFFECSQDICVGRCLDRGAGGSGRTDDNMESLKKRFHTYVNDTLPVIKHYEAQNLVKQVDASGTSDQVFDLLKPHFANL